MRSPIPIILLLNASLATAQAGPTTSAESESCRRLRVDLERIDKALASSTAEGAVGSNKSARLRAVEGDNMRLLGQSVVSEMMDHGCPQGLPLSNEPFLLAAIKCEKEKRLQPAATPLSCNKANWKPYSE